MRPRTLFLAALSMAAFHATMPTPAAAQLATDWKQSSATVSFRVVGVTRELFEGRSRILITWEVENTGPAVALRDIVRPYAINDVGSTRLALETFSPEALAARPLSTTLGPGFNRLVSMLPVDGAGQFVYVVFGQQDQMGRFNVLGSHPISQLTDDALTAVLDPDLVTVAGHWRTNMGAILKVTRDRSSLYARSETVGATSAPALRWNFPREARGILHANLFASEGLVAPVSTLTLSHEVGTRLRGRFTTGQHRNLLFSACRASEQDAVSDPQLRGGSSFWARLEGTRATPADNGKVQLDVTIRVWNVHGSAASFQALYGTPARPVAWLEQIRDGRPTAATVLQACDTDVITYRATARPNELQQIFFSGGPNFTATSVPWDMRAVVDGVGTPGPAPAPPSPAPPVPPSSPSPSTGGGPIVVGRPVPARLRDYANYGIWDMKVEELAPGPDGNWQAVVRVRDAAIYRVGLTDDGVMVTLFDEDGRSVQSIPTLFRASVTGPIAALEAIPQTMWMEKGDEIRVRLFIRQSAGFKPVRVRLGSNDRETFSRTFPFE